jgi:hypothetical protein
MERSETLPDEATDFIRRFTLLSISAEEYAFILETFRRTEKKMPEPGAFLGEFERTWKALAADGRRPSAHTELFRLFDRLFRCPAAPPCADLVVRARCGAVDLACIERPCP